MIKKGDKRQSLVAMASYCAYQERCFSEVEKKMETFELSEEENQEIIDWLVADKFLDEERYAASFVRGKFNHKKWGKNKIKTALRQKGIPNSLITNSLKEIAAEDYYETILSLLKKKNQLLSETDSHKRKHKLYNYALSKGYESEVVFNALDDVLNTSN